MAGAGYRNWTAGDIPTADQFDTFLQEQTVMNFEDATARDTALSLVKAEGMVAYLRDVNLFTVYDGAAWQVLAPFFKFASAAARNTALAGVLTEGLFAYLVDTNTLTVYSGAAWSTVGPLHGALTAWTPTVAQGVGITITNQYSRHHRSGRLVTGFFAVTCTTAGTAGQHIQIDMPFDSVATDQPCGVAYFLDASTGVNHLAVLFAGSGGGVVNFDLRATNNLLADPRIGSGVAVTVANGDIIRGQFAYEAAADA